jgi:hypothetical protein
MKLRKVMCSTNTSEHGGVMVTVEMYEHCQVGILVLILQEGLWLLSRFEYLLTFLGIITQTTHTQIRHIVTVSLKMYVYMHSECYQKALLMPCTSPEGHSVGCRDATFVVQFFRYRRKYSSIQKLIRYDFTIL